jgi:hypothetical protein
MISAIIFDFGRVTSARKLGIHGIVFTTAGALRKSLINAPGFKIDPGHSA